VINLQTSRSDVSLSTIAEKVWPAFQKAIEATQFYPKLKLKGQELIQQHWPILIPTLASALGVTLGMGSQGNDWRGMQRLSSLLPMLNQELPLTGNWMLTLGFAESQPIKGAGERGVVLGVNPSIGFRYKSDMLQFSVGGSVNLRIETGQESTRGVQVNASPGAQATLRW
jgi:hypothetical protein